MTNVVRHARASRCEVRLCVEDGRLVVDVADDGVGVDPARGAGVGRPPRPRHQAGHHEGAENSIFFVKNGFWTSFSSSRLKNRRTRAWQGLVVAQKLKQRGLIA